MTDYTDVVEITIVPGTITAAEDGGDHVDETDADTALTGHGGGGGGGSVTTYTNRVWNTTSTKWVRWDTTPAADPTGASYPGPGTFAVDTQTPAHVEKIVVA